MLLTASTVAQAQAGASSIAMIGGGWTNQQTDCTNGVYYEYVLGQGATSASCDVNYSLLVSHGSSFGGVLTSYSSVSSAGAPPGIIPAGNAYATNEWADQINFAPGSVLPAYVQVTTRWRGTLSAYHLRDMWGSTVAAVGGYATAGQTYGPAQYGYASHQLVAGYQSPGYRDPDPLNQATYDEFVSLLVPLNANGSPTVFFTMQLHAITDMGGAFNWLDVPAEYATSSFTASVASITFLDAQSNVIDDADVNYTLANGTVVTATPEPATLALVATGLIALGAFGKRKRDRGFTRS